MVLNTSRVEFGVCGTSVYVVFDPEKESLDGFKGKICNFHREVTYDIN